MNARLTIDVHSDHVTDLHRRAAERRRTRAGTHGGSDAIAIGFATASSISIHRASAADGPTIARLAELDSAAPLSGETLIASVDGEPRAAIEIATGATIADPFHHTRELVELLQLRAGRLSGATSSPLRLSQLRRRVAPRAA